MRSVINVLKEKLFKQQTATKLFTLFRLAWNSFSDADILRVYGFPESNPKQRYMVCLSKFIFNQRPV